MRYHIGRVLHQLYFYRRRYFIIWLELLVGIVILSISANKLLTTRAAMEEIEQSLNKENMLVQYEYLGDASMKIGVPIEYEHYKTVKEEFAPELALSYTAAEALAVFGTEDVEEVPGCWLVFMDDTAFAGIFDGQRKADAVYVGEKAMKVLQLCQEKGEQLFLMPEIDLKVNDREVSWQADFCEVNAMPATSAKEILTQNSGLYIMEQDRILLEECLIFPVEWVRKLESQPDSIGCQSVLKAEGKNKETEMAAMNRLTERLGELNPKFAFQISDQYLSLKEQQEDMDWIGLYWLRISIVVLLLVGGSMTGILLVLLYQRRRMKAVAYVCGSTKLQLELETLGELAMLFMAAVIPGGMLGWWLNINEKTGIRQLRYFPQSNLILLGAALLILAAVYLLAGIWERRISFIQVLKGE